MRLVTQGELAERAGVRRATVNRVENAAPTSIDLRVLDQLATALGVEPGFLLVRTPGGRQRSQCLGLGPPGPHPRKAPFKPSRHLARCELGAPRPDQPTVTCR